MSNARGKSIDNTHLSIDQAERRGFLHRDYIAHCLRWSHVAGYIQKGQKYKTTRILDVGCGVDLPLAKLLYSSRLIVEEYVGVDYNRPDKFDLAPFHTGKMPVHAYGDVEFPKDLSLADSKYAVGTPAEDESNVHQLPNVIVCFEVLEHVEPAHARELLEAFKLLLQRSPNAVAFISTPCFDEQVGAAANHVNEMTYHALGGLLEDLGFDVSNHWGTFASQKDYKAPFLERFNTDGPAIWSILSEYYDSNYLATVFAPIFPQYARNCLWELRLAEEGYERQFTPLAHLSKDKRWTSSERWAELEDF